MKTSIYSLLLAILLFSCNPETKIDSDSNKVNQAKGKLFIIGGGKRPPSLINKLIEISNINTEGYGIILPMSSSEPDSAIYYSNIQFEEQGLNTVIGKNLLKGELPNQSLIDSIENANLIYISGGDQNKFMDIISGTGIREAINNAYNRGAVIAGTSAGAAVMSEVMITGNEKNYPDYDNTLRNIEADNIITAEGLGLIKTAIVDQHFIKRGRYNRLISIVIEHPDLIGVGIDESTALIVSGDSATVTGESQVIRIINNNQSSTKLNNKLGIDNLSVSVLLPGNKFSLKK